MADTAKLKNKLNNYVIDSLHPGQNSLSQYINIFIIAVKHAISLKMIIN